MQIKTMQNIIVSTELLHLVSTFSAEKSVKKCKNTSASCIFPIFFATIPLTHYQESYKRVVNSMEMSFYILVYD